MHDSIPTVTSQEQSPMQTTLPFGAIFWPAALGQTVPTPPKRAIADLFIESWTLKNGAVITVRPICPTDEPAMVEFHRSLSEESVYLRYSHLIKLNRRINHDRLSRICNTERDREWVFVAEYYPSVQESATVPPESAGSESAPPAPVAPEIIAVARLNKLPDNHTAEFALLVSDAFQHQGLGSRLLNWLLHIAQIEHIDHVIAEMLPENAAMEHLCQKQGFHLHNHITDGVVIADLELAP